MPKIESSDPESDRSLLVEQYTDGLRVAVDDPGFGLTGVTISREDLAIAVRDLGFVVIDRAERPVHDSGTHYEVGHQTYRKDAHTATSARVAGEELLALAEYLEANPPVPPVDEATVEALFAAASVEIENQGLTPEPSADKRLIRALLATGRIEIKDPS